MFFLCFTLVFACPALSRADEPKYRNPKPSFKKLSPEEVERLAPIKLGKIPLFTGNELKKIKAGKIILREQQMKGKARRNEAIGIVHATPHEVMSFMRDYPAYVGAFPHLKKIKAEWEGDNLVHTENTLKIAFVKVFYRLNVRHLKDSVLEWEFVDGDFRDTNGYYKFFPYNDGKDTLVLYHVYTDTGLPVPQFIIDLLTTSSMPDVIEAIRKEVAKRRKS